MGFYWGNNRSNNNAGSLACWVLGALVADRILKCVLGHFLKQRYP